MRTTHWLIGWLSLPTLLVAGFLSAAAAGEHSPDAALSILDHHPEMIYLGLAVFFLLLGFIVVLLHINMQWKQAQRTLAEREKDLRVTLNSIGDAVIATDAVGRITRMNPVAERLTGWSIEEALGKALEEVFVILNGKTRKSVSNPAQAVVESGDVVGLANDTILVDRDGTERQISDSAAPIRGTGDELVGVVLVFRDITEKYALQHRLRQAEKLEAIGRLAGGIAHDFNNMLGGIIGFADILARRLEGEERLQGHAKSIIRTANRAADLTEKMLTFARRSRLEQSPINVHLCIDDALTILERSIDPRIELKRDLSAEHSVVLGDPSAIESAILNLGVNARDAMPEGGVLRITTRNIKVTSPDDAPQCAGLHPGEYIEVRMEDNGVGIDESAQELVFEPFFTTKADGAGTGLGLPAVHGTVRAMGGDVALSSQPGKGTTVIICLPVTTGKRAQVQPERGDVITGTGRILLVDDEAVIRQSISEMLQDLGYEVLLAENGEQSLATFRERHDEIDLVLMDLTMPRMNGPDCFQAMREVDPDARAVIMSGYSETFSGLSGINVPVLQKPFGRIRLSQAVADALGATPTLPDAPGPSSQELSKT